MWYHKLKIESSFKYFSLYATVTRKDVWYNAMKEGVDGKNWKRLA